MSQQRDNLFGMYFFLNQKRGKTVNTMHTSMMRHPNAIEAAQRDAPSGTALVGQYVVHKLEDARDRGSKESGLPTSELVVLGGHYGFRKRDGVQKFHDGFRVYARLQKPTHPLRGGTNNDEPPIHPETQRHLREQAEEDERRRADIERLTIEANAKREEPKSNGVHQEKTMPEPTKEDTRRTLSLTETLRLVDWLRDNFEGIAKSGDSKLKVAEIASKKLGFDISESTLHRIAKELNLDWKVAVVRQPSDNNAARRARKAIVNTVRYLFDKLGEKLPQEFTEEFGE
jgi:hypothetical protein